MSAFRRFALRPASWSLARPLLVGKGFSRLYACLLVLFVLSSLRVLVRPLPTFRVRLDVIQPITAVLQPRTATRVLPRRRQQRMCPLLITRMLPSFSEPV